MASEQASDGSTLRYAADDKPPLPFSIVVGIQTSLLACIPVVVVTTVVAQVANQSEAYLRWAVFASIVIGGLTTIIQARRPGGVGAGTLTVMGASGAATGVAVLALVAGGPPLLGVLVVASALGQLVFASRLALLRRIITPTLSGILLVLIAVTVVPLGFEMLSRVPAAAPATAAPTVALATVATVVALVFKAPRILRAWTPVLGIAAGCVVAALFGIFDLGRVREASWVGLPEVAFPGLDLGFDSRFWVLLPGFLFVSFVITVRQVGDTVLMQRASHRDPRAIDFRRVQGGVVACGAGTLLSGLAGVLPPWPFAAGKVLASGAGVAARRIGVFVGTIFLALAFVPKLTTLVLSIPPPVLGSYIIIFFGSVFAEGMRVIFRGLIDQRNAMIIGFSFWIGVGVQLGAIFPDYLVSATGGLPVDGLTAGGLTFFTLNLLLALAGSPPAQDGDTAPPRQPAPTRPVRPGLRQAERLGRRGRQTSPRRVRRGAAEPAAGGEGAYPAGRRASTPGRRLEHAIRRRAGIPRRPPRPATSKTRFCTSVIPPTHRATGICPLSCCATTPRPCDTGSTTTWTSLRWVWTAK